MDVKVIDNDGVWLVNRSQYRYPDPENGVCYEPSLPTRVKLTEWAAAQPLIEQIDDPFTAEPRVMPKANELLRENPDNVSGNANAAASTRKK